MIKIKMDERPPTVHDQWLIQVLRSGAHRSAAQAILYLLWKSGVFMFKTMNVTRTSVK